MSATSFPPDDEAEIDREIRIEKRKRELDELVGGLMISGGFGDVPPTIEDAFLAHVYQFEKAELETNFNRLVRRGITMEAPDELDDAALSAKLEEMLHILGMIRCFLQHTDHLSDRHLYTWLWTKGLREETPDMSGFDGGAWHTSPIGSCDDEDMATFLQYYANEEERRRWHEQFPKDPLPPHHPLPYDRDRNLSRPEIS
jgi:hypothetical protein